MKRLLTRKVLSFSLALAALLLGGGTSALLGVCGIFTDVSGPFCPFILELYYLGVTAGTSATTFSPNDPVTRGQMAVFTAKGIDQSLKRGSRRAALDQFWTPQNALSLGVTTFATDLLGPVKSDGTDIWVSNANPGSVSRVRASDGKLLADTWSVQLPGAFLVAMGRVFVASSTSPGALHAIDPTAPGTVVPVANNVGTGSAGLAFDGSRIWRSSSSGSVAIVTPGPTIPWGVTTVSTGFSGLAGILFDGANIWVTDILAGTLLKLDANGAILQTVTVGAGPAVPVFDGTNIWVPNYSDSSVTVVRAATGAVLQTLTGNGLSQPAAAAFDGQRILVTNQAGNSASLWKAADLTPLGSFPLGATPFGVCSDGLNFWIVLPSIGGLARF